MSIDASEANGCIAQRSPDIALTDAGQVIPRVLLCHHRGWLRSAIERTITGLGFQIFSFDNSWTAVKARGPWNLAIVTTSDDIRDLKSATDAFVADSILVLRQINVDGCLDDAAIRSATCGVFAAGAALRLSGCALHAGALARKRLTFGDLELHIGSRIATVNGADIGLTPSEYRVLEFMALRRGEVVGISELTCGMSNSRRIPASNVVAQVVLRLRIKLRSCGYEDPIVTRRGYGYVFDPSSS